MLDAPEINDVPRFSKKILFLSLALLAISIAWFGLASYSGMAPFYRPVAPRLIFAGNQDVSIKTIFDSDFTAANPDQIIRIGTQVKTGDQAFAELELDGNILRLDQGTIIALDENNFTGQSYASNPENPRLTFTLLSGSVWVNAREPLRVEAARGAATFVHSVGSYTYAQPMNRVMVVTGSANIALDDEKGVVAADSLVPSHYQITFTDSQITSNYARLQPSKLKKELKLGVLTGGVLDDEWVRRNTASDLLSQTYSRKYIGAFTHAWRDQYYKIRSSFSWFPETRRRLELARMQNDLDFLFSNLDKKEVVESALGDIDSLSAGLDGDPDLIHLLAEGFYSISYAPFDSPAFLAKEAFRNHLLAKKGSLLLRTYLTDIERDMRLANFDHLLPHIELWFAHWDKKRASDAFAEFENQARIYHALLLAYPNALSPDYLSVLKQMADLRVAYNPNTEEALLAIVDEYINLGAALVNHQKYLLAKQVLAVADKALHSGQFDTNNPSHALFAQRVDLLAERISFTQTELHGAAEPIDETRFREYLRRKARDENLSENLKSFLNFLETDSAEEPTAEDVTRRFAAAHISVIAEDIKPDPDFSFGFNIESARLMDRAKNGSLISFSAIYDFTTNAVHDIHVNGRLLKGNFELQDLAVVLTEGNTQAPTAVPAFSVDTEWFADQNDEMLRAQALAQDLAVQLVLEELKQAGMQVAGAAEIDILNTSTLNQFRIKKAEIQDLQSLNKKLQITFEFNLSGKRVDDAQFIPDSLSLPPRIPLANFVQTIYSVVYIAREQADLMNQIRDTLTAEGLVADPNYFTLESADRFRFDHLKLASVPLEVSGVYDSSANLFAEVSHALLSETNVSIENYFNRLVPLFVMDYLKRNGIDADSSQLIAVSPFDSITVSDFEAGEHALIFKVNMKANRLENVSVQGNESSLESMTFEEFNNAVQSFQKESGISSSEDVSEEASIAPEDKTADESRRRAIVDSLHFFLRDYLTENHRVPGEINTVYCLDETAQGEGFDYLRNIKSQPDPSPVTANYLKQLEEGRFPDLSNGEIDFVTKLNDEHECVNSVMYIKGSSPTSFLLMTGIEKVTTSDTNKNKLLTDSQVDFDKISKFILLLGYGIAIQELEEAQNNVKDYFYIRVDH